MDIQKERKAFEAYMAEKYKNLMDRRQCLNNGGGYMAWDMNVAWKVWQAAKAHEAEKLKGCVVVPVEPTPKMIDAVRSEHEGEPYLPYSLYKSFLKAATVEAARGGNE